MFTSKVSQKNKQAGVGRRRFFLFVFTIPYVWDICLFTEAHKVIWCSVCIQRIYPACLHSVSWVSFQFRSCRVFIIGVRWMSLKPHVSNVKTKCERIFNIGYLRECHFSSVVVKVWWHHRAKSYSKKLFYPNYISVSTKRTKSVASTWRNQVETKKLENYQL